MATPPPAAAPARAPEPTWRRQRLSALAVEPTRRLVALAAVVAVAGDVAVRAGIAGVAGALYVPQVGIINPGEFAPGNSIEAVIWVAVGGRGTLVGAALGAVVVNYAKTVFTSGPLAPYWLFMLGALFILVTLLLPKGIIGTFNAWWEPRRAKGDTAVAESAAAEDGVGKPLAEEVR